jgi:hypothetical protein
METISTLRTKLRKLFIEIYGFEPTFGSSYDWQNKDWLIRMYNSLYKEFHSLPEELNQDMSMTKATIRRIK